jgi:hypothetical protein
MNWQINNSKSLLFIILAIGMTMIYFGSCTNDDTVVEPPVVNGKDLVAVKVTTPPAIDGVVDAQWDQSPKLEFETVVPDPSGDLFRGYVGTTIPSVTLRSAYDNENIYFLAEWWDPTQSLARQPWYFDPAAKLWKQEKGAPTFTTPATTPPTSARAAFYEDKVAMLWNIDHSVSGWDQGTCYKSCHTDLGVNDGYARHYTANSTERIDMWHWKSVRGGVNAANQIHDQYQTNTYPNGRKSDSGTDVYVNNTQTIGGVSVPKYMIPGRTKYYWILNSEITAGSALLITNVDAEGILTLSDGSTINPNVDTDYQRNGADVGLKAIAGVTLADEGYVGNSGDISCKAVYTGTGWILEFKRALKTGDTERQDIDFSSLEDQFFGFAVFENAQIAHSIKANLLLKFKK